MRAGLCALILLAACASAQAAEVRFPATGKAQFTVQVPDGWTSTPDNVKLSVAAGDGTADVAFSIMELSEPLDEIAAGLMQSVNSPDPSRRDTASLSGLPGYTYFSTAADAAGKPAADLRLTLARIDKTHVMMSFMILAKRVDGEEAAQAQAAQTSLRLAKP